MSVASYPFTQSTFEKSTALFFISSLSFCYIADGRNWFSSQLYLRLYNSSFFCMPLYTICLLHCPDHQGNPSLLPSAVFAVSNTQVGFQIEIAFHYIFTFSELNKLNPHLYNSILHLFSLNYWFIMMAQTLDLCTISREAAFVVLPCFSSHVRKSVLCFDLLSAYVLISALNITGCLIWC